MSLAYGDQRGVSQSQPGKPSGAVLCDIGAYEFAPQDLGIYGGDTSPDPVQARLELTFAAWVTKYGPGRPSTSA